MGRRRSECDDSCGGIDEMLSISQRMDRYGQMHDLHGIVEAMGELCGYPIVATFISSAIC